VANKFLLLLLLLLLLLFTTCARICGEFVDVSHHFGLYSTSPSLLDYGRCRFPRWIIDFVEFSSCLRRFVVSVHRRRHLIVLERSWRRLREIGAKKSVNKTVGACVRRTSSSSSSSSFTSSVFGHAVTQPQSVRYRLGIMETRSRTRVRATNSPPREVTEGGTQPVKDVFVDPPSSAIGLSGDGKVSSRSTSWGLVPAAPAVQPSVVRAQTRNMGQPRERCTRKIANSWILRVAILSVFPPQTNGRILQFHIIYR